MRSVFVSTVMTVALSAGAARAAPVIVDNLWQETIQSLCISTGVCTFDFTKIEGPQTLVVTNVSCVFSLASASAGFASVELMRKRGTDVLPSPKVNLSPTKTGEVPDTIQYWAVTNQVTHLVKGSHRARIEATLASSAFYGGKHQFCTVVGKLIPTP